MHEASIAAPLLRLVLEEAARHEREQKKRLRITHILVKSGLLMNIEERSLKGIFALMAEETPAAGAELTLELEPMQGRCPECQAAVSARTRDFRCPGCGGAQVDWSGGNELYIASIKVAPDTEAHAPNEDTHHG